MVQFFGIRHSENGFTGSCSDADRMNAAHAGAADRMSFRFIVILLEFSLFSGPVSVETLAPVNGFHMSVLE